MSTSSEARDQFASINWVKVGGLTIVLAVIAFLLSPNAPFGSFWAPDAHMPGPSTGQLPFLILLNITEVVTFGLGVSFLVFGYPMVQAIAPASFGLTRAVHLSIAWLLLSWWPHDSLHVHNGVNLGGLIVIEYLFHITLMIAGVILAYFFLTLQRRAH